MLSSPLSFRAFLPFLCALALTSAPLSAEAQESGAGLGAPRPAPAETTPEEAPEEAPPEVTDTEAAAEGEGASEGSSTQSSSEESSSEETSTDATTDEEASASNSEPAAAVGEESEGAEASENGETEEAAPETEAPAAIDEFADPSSQRTVMVVDAAVLQVAPVISQHVTERMRATAAEMGYRVLTRDETVGAAQRSNMAYPPTPADLWRATWFGQAHHGAFARVWARDGRYVIEMSAASLDGTGPHYQSGTASAEELHAVVARMTRELLPATSEWDEAGAQAIASQQPATSAAQPQIPVMRNPVTVPRRPRRASQPTRRFDVSFGLEGAIGGLNTDGFFNFLGNVRLGFRITNTLHLGVRLSYVNANARDGRASSIMPMGMIENRIRLGRGTDITIPISFGVGYLPFNGPVVRLAAGLNIPIGERMELGLDILTPTFWVIPNETAISLNLGARLVYRL